MTCREMRLLLSPWVDGELSPERSREVAAHVAACDECSAAVETIRALRAAVRDLRPQGGDEGLAALRRRLEDDRRRRPGRRLAVAALAAALLLALGIGWLFRATLWPPDGPRQAAAPPALERPQPTPPPPAATDWDEPSPVEQAGLTAIGPEDLSLALGQLCADPADCGGGVGEGAAGP